MCEPTNFSTSKEDPALELAQAFNKHFAFGKVPVGPFSVRSFILARWPDIKRWAHAIHEEGEKGEAELREAAQMLSGINAEGLLKAAKGDHTTFLNEAFMKLAKRALKEEAK